MSAEPLIITRRDIRRVMQPADYLDAVELAFRAAAAGRASSTLPLHLPTADGAFHGKGATISLDRDYVAVKVNGNFPANPAKHGLPTIQGAILLFDGGNGRLLAVLDSIEVTIQRTAAATTLAAKMLAPTGSATLICGCGEQGRAHAAMLGETLAIRRLLFWDCNSERSERLAAELGGEAVEELGSAARSADIIVTCTTSTIPFLEPAMVSAGAFIGAVGTDNCHKSEIAPALMAAARVVTDSTAQCLDMGDLHHAVSAGAMSASDVHAELGQLLAGEKVGRCSPDEIFIFDSTGTGLQDVAAAAAVFERCAGDKSIRSVALSAV